MYCINVFASIVYYIIHMFILLNILFQGNFLYIMFMGLRQPRLIYVVASSLLSKGWGCDKRH